LFTSRNASIEHARDDERMVIYKYLKKEHLLKFKVDGSIRINTLYKVREIEHTPIRDALEGRRIIRISSNTQPLSLSGKEFGRLLPQLSINQQQEDKTVAVIENGAQFDMQIANAYIFCTSLKFGASLFKKFEYDAYYTITDPFRFADILYEKLNQAKKFINGFKVGAVKYADRPIVLTEENKQDVLQERDSLYWSTCFTKPKSFSEEQEFRMVFASESRDIEPITLQCPELKKYCVF
jgi:hypothetical protein